MSLVSSFQICAPQNINGQNPHGIDPRFVELGGWVGYIKALIAPEIEWMRAGGLKPRVLLQNSFSCQAGFYQFDQYIHAADAGLITTHGFIEAWRPVTESGVEVINYTGTLHDDKNFTKLLANPYGGDDFMRRLERSVQVPINAGMSLGFDYANNWHPDSAEFTGISLVRAVLKDGAKAYIEPGPSKDRPHTWGWDSITQYRYWNGKRDWFAADKDITGEVVLWVDQSPEALDANMLAAAFQLILADGHTPCGITGYLRLAGYQAKDFTQ